MTINPITVVGTMLLLAAAAQHATGETVHSKQQALGFACLGLALIVVGVLTQDLWGAAR